MPRGGAHFSSEELVRVLSYYDIGVIEKLSPLSAGNRQTPKMIVAAEKGRFLLKRRPKGKDDLYRVAFAHSIQNYLSQKKFPVTTLIFTSEEDNTVLKINSHIYELFEYIDGSRYDGGSESTVDAGRQLAEFHIHLADFASQWKPLRGSFHDSSTVRRHLKTVSADKMAGTDNKIQHTAEVLMSLYNNSSIHVNELGFDSWSEQIVHGDWHPGNLLFADNKVIAVVDFDSIKIAPPVTDLANGMLQFSIVGNRPNPADWPDYLDQAKLVSFLKGYFEIIQLDENRLEALPDLIAPEQIRGEVDIDGRADIYGLGATFYHMVTGRVPFMADDPADVMRKHLKEQLVPPDHINTSLSAGVSEVIEVMMAKRKEDRYSNVEELLIDLEAVQNGQPPLRAHKRFDVSMLEQLEKGQAVQAIQDVDSEEIITRYKIAVLSLGAVAAVFLLIIIFLLLF